MGSTGIEVKPSTSPYSGKAHVRGLTFRSSQIYIDHEKIKVKGPYSYILILCLLALRKTEEYLEQNLP
jgi:hypothetical protein